MWRMIVLVLVWSQLTVHAYAVPSRVNDVRRVSAFHTVTIHAISVRDGVTSGEQGALIMVRCAPHWEPCAMALGSLTVDYDVWRRGIVDVSWPVGVYPMGSYTSYNVVDGRVLVVWYAEDTRPVYVPLPDVQG